VRAASGLEIAVSDPLLEHAIDAIGDRHDLQRLVGRASQACEGTLAVRWCAALGARCTSYAELAG
jgi:hypothetical protein